MTNALLTFIGAEELAKRKTAEGHDGWPSYLDWLAQKQRETNRMPQWFWQEHECKQRYIAQIESNLTWEQQQASINEGYAALNRKLTEAV